MFYFITAVIILTFSRLYLNFKKANSQKFPTPKKLKKLNLLSVLGSGGHTNEMLRLLKNLPSPNNSNKFIYHSYFFLAETDKHSLTKLENFFKEGQAHLSTKKQGLVPDLSRANLSLKATFTIPRSREVGQTYISSIFTTLTSLLHCKNLISSLNPDVLLINGPGTCIPVLFWACINSFIKSKKLHVIFVESFCRVSSLSLSGLIIYYLGVYDDFFVQWPELKVKYRNVKYVGRIL